MPGRYAAPVSHAPDLDVLLVSDFRFPGGTSASAAEEIRVQHRAGLSTGLVQVFGGLLAGSRPVNPQIRSLVTSGAARLIAPYETVSARVAVLRHPALFTDELLKRRPSVSAETVVLVANQAATDHDGTVHYDPVEVDRVVTALFGRRPVWAPIGPAVRPSLAPFADRIDIRPEDWLNLIPAEEWAADRGTFRADVPVIGRHSRPQRSKWPSTAEDLLAVYPDSDDVRVRVLGGADPAEELLGAVPERWEVEPFNARHPRQFLADLDFFVYFHHPAMVEAYGRAVMEALASGCVAILSEDFREPFGDAALYCRPEEVQGLVQSLRADRAAYLAQSERGLRFVAERHGAQVHLDRLTELGLPVAPLTVVPATRPAADHRDRVLFVTSNGAGMGHLTRLLAMAKRASGRVEPVFLSLSQAVPVVGPEGYAFEYVPSRGALGCGTGEWNEFFRVRFVEALRRWRPRAVVFDGTWPYNGLVDAMDEFPEIKFVWSRRAMWKPELGGRQLAKASRFDLIVEPGEYAAAVDVGATTTVGDAVRVGPITLLDESDLLDRETARGELGVTGDGPAVLVNLGAGNINDLSSDLGVIVDVLSRHEGTEVWLTRPPIAAGRPISLPPHVHTISVYPLSRYVRAFDVAVAASGYNSYHEFVAFGVPTVFIPNMATLMDNQLARAEYAATAGVGTFLPEGLAALPHEQVEAAFAAVLDPERRAAMARTARATYPGNGAAAAMAAVEQLLSRAERTAS
jgi:hypothetical protein